LTRHEKKPAIKPSKKGITTEAGGKGGKRGGRACLDVGGGALNKQKKVSKRKRVWGKKNTSKEKG